MIIKKDPEIIKSYLEDSSNLKGGFASEVVLPSKIEELSEFIKEANAKKKPVTISGGGTATTGSRIPFGGSVISMEKFNAISEISPSEMRARVQTGVFVEELKFACEQKGLFYTSHPTERAASIGGTIATNASGSRSLKYGPTRKYVNRLKMVLPTGDIIEIKRGDKFLSSGDSQIALPSGIIIDIPMPSYKMPNVKNSAGYFVCPGMDLIDLFIGQEGTLSVIVEIELGLEKKPERILSSFLFFDEECSAWSFAQDARSENGILSIEYFDSNSLELLRAGNTNVPANKKAAIFFEQEITLDGEDAVLERWSDLISKNKSTMDDAWVAMNESDAELFTKMRHSIPDAINDIYRKSGYSKLSTDIAVPDNKFREMLDFYMDSFKGSGLSHAIFGHIGESHLHVNMLPRSPEEDVRARELSMTFVKKALSLGGTVSAEHGIGKLKHKYLEAMYGRAGVLEMAKIKKAFDPNCILGLDNIFPKEYLAYV